MCEKKTGNSDAPSHAEILTADEEKVYARWIHLLNQSEVAYMIGGAFALYAHTGIWRSTKDLDIFIRPQDLKPILDAMRAAGCEAEVTDPSWLAKVRQRPYTLDLIFALTHNEIEVNLDFLGRASEYEILGIATPIMPVEELIASKACIVKSYRFDGADILHLIRCAEGDLDWPRLMTLFEAHPELLLWYLVLFSFVYPDSPRFIRKDLVRKLFGILEDRWGDGRTERFFHGTLLDPDAFYVDCKLWGYENSHPRPPLVNRKGEAI